MTSQWKLFQRRKGNRYFTSFRRSCASQLPLQDVYYVILRAAWISQNVPVLGIFRNLNEADTALTDHQNVTTALE